MSAKPRAKEKGRLFKSLDEFRSTFFPREEALRIAESDPFAFGAKLAEGSVSEVRPESAEAKGG